MVHLKFTVSHKHPGKHCVTNHFTRTHLVSDPQRIVKPEELPTENMQKKKNNWANCVTCRKHVTAATLSFKYILIGNFHTFPAKWLPLLCNYPPWGITPFPERLCTDFHAHSDRCKHSCHSQSRLSPPCRRSRGVVEDLRLCSPLQEVGTRLRLKLSQIVLFMASHGFSSHFD